VSDLTTIGEGAPWAIVIRPGRTFSRPFWLREADGTTRVPLDGWDGAAQVRDIEGRLLLTLTVDVSQETDPDSPDCGLVTVSAAPAQTAAVGVPGVWDLVLTRGGGPDLETRDLVSRSDALLGQGVTVL